MRNWLGLDRLALWLARKSLVLLVRARVLPTGPEVLPEDDIDEVDEFDDVEEGFDAFHEETPEIEQDEQLEPSSISTGAFAAMEGDATPEAEAAPVSGSDTDPE